MRVAIEKEMGRLERGMKDSGSNYGTASPKGALGGPCRLIDPGRCAQETPEATPF